jgi:hypothetical protein
MPSANYMIGRKKYGRPQAMLWSENPGTISTLTAEGQQPEEYYVPVGFEIGTNTQGVLDTSLLNQFIILSDDNRSEIDFNIERIEKRERMINGRMRSYHIADKLTIDVSWDMLPSRSFGANPAFNLTTGVSPIGGPSTSESATKPPRTGVEYTTDGGAGGAEILKWYEDHKSSFWVYLAYDKYTNFPSMSERYGQLKKYNQVLEMFISNFSYSVVKRGTNNFDFWNIQVTLEEA